MIALYAEAEGIPTRVLTIQDQTIMHTIIEHTSPRGMSTKQVAPGELVRVVTARGKKSVGREAPGVGSLLMCVSIACSPTDYFVEISTGHTFTCLPEDVRVELLKCGDKIEIVVGD